MKLSKRHLALVGLVIFALVLSRIDISRMLGILSAVNVPLYALSGALILLLVILKGLKWKLVLRSMGVSISLPEAVRLYSIGLFLSNATPGKIGDFAKAWYLKGRVNLPVGLASVFVDRIMDVALLVLFSSLSALWFIYYYKITLISPVLLAVIIAIFFAAFLLLVKESYMKALARPVFQMLVPEKHKKGLSELFSEFFSAVKSVKARPAPIAASVILGAGIWALNAIVFCLIAASISISAPLYGLFAVFPIVTLTDMLPISLSGLGTRDAALIFLLALFSVSAESAVAVSLLVFFIGYLLTSLVGLFFFSTSKMKIGL